MWKPVGFILQTVQQMCKMTIRAATGLTPSIISKVNKELMV